MAEQDTRQRTTQSSDDGQATSCYKVAQNLPVYLNGRLADDEAQALEAHLTTCSACRREERETRTAWDLYEGHLPVDLLLDFAMAQPMPSRQRAVIESHLAQCERCSEEVATVRQEPANTGSITAAAPTSAQGQAGARTREPTSRHWRQLAWAASFVAIIAGIGWLRTWQQLADTRTLTTTVTARTNLPVVELLPATQPLLRQGRKPPPAAANPVALHEDA
ncbi:MAG: zf-HC2 domain-containing protein, partial [Acidobacteriota bacterium]